jgi:hypothetical protein
MTHFVPVAVLPAPAGLEERVKATLETQAAFKREATAAAAIEAAMVSISTAAVNDLARKGQRKGKRAQRPSKPRPAILLSAIKVGRMAEAAWELLSPTERVEGIQLWKLAALANLHFIPTPARKLFELHGSTMVFELIRPDAGEDAKGRYGFAFVSRNLPGMGSRLLGIKIFDHQGHTLMVAGQAPMGAHERVSPFTEGIFNGQDRLPKGWKYWTKAGVPNEEITAFIAATMPRREEL